MKKVFFTIGPTKLYPTVVDHIQTAIKEDILSISHRGSQFKEIYAQAIKELRTLMNVPTTHHIFFVSSGTEAMERTIESLVDKTSLHIITGAFGERFYRSSQMQGNQVIKVDINEENVQTLFTYTPAIEPELICITQCDSSNGFAFPDDTCQKLRKTYPKALIALDAVSSAPVMSIDFNSLDVALFSAQKCFGLPAGIAVIVVSNAALVKAEVIAEKKRITYHTFSELQKHGANNSTPETPNVFGIYLLSKVAFDMNKKGIEVIRKEEAEKASLIYNFFDNAQDRFRPVVRNSLYRSPTIAVIEPLAELSTALVSRLEEHGFFIGGGYSKNKDTQFRIANYPAHTLEEVQELLSEFD